MRDTERISIGKPLPRIGTVVPLEGRRLQVAWDNGQVVVVDMSVWLVGHPHLAAQLQDDDVFRAVSVGEWGAYLTWGGDVEVPTDVLETLVVSP